MRLLFKAIIGLAGLFAAGEIVHVYGKHRLVARVKRENPPSASVLNVGAGRGLPVWQTTFAGTTKCDINPVPSQGVEYGDIRKLPYADKSFDAVICSHVLEHLDSNEVHQGMQELNRVVKDPRKVYIALPNPVFPQTLLNPQHKSIIIGNRAYNNPFSLTPKHIGTATVGGYTLRSFARWAAGATHIFI